MAGMNAADIGVIVAYLAGLVTFGLLVSRRQSGAESYFLASHGVTWPIIGLALLASTISPTALIGITGSAYGLGISVFNYEWVASLVLILFAIAFLPTIIRARVFTVPEFLERRFGRPTRLWFAAMSLLLGMLLDAAGLYGGALVLCRAVPAVSVQSAVAILAILAGGYAVSGGLKSVMYTQSVQAIAVLAAACMVSLIVFDRAGGLAHVLETADPHKLSLIRPASDPAMPWTGLLLGAPVLSFYFWCTNQSMVQRMLAARSLRDAQLGALFAGVLKLLILPVIVLPGIAAILLFPELERPDGAYPAMMFELLPTGLLGFVLAAFAGALLAQLSTAYITTGTLLAMDVVRVVKSTTDEAMLVRWGRAGTLASMIFSVFWAPQIARFPSLWQYLQAVLAYVTPPVVALFLVGLMWRGASSRGAIAALIAGNLVGLCLFGAAVAGVWDFHFLHAAALLLLVSSAALIIGSVLMADRSAIAGSGRDRQGVGWFVWERPRLDVSLWAVALLLLTISIVFWLR
jgi:SSS family solute:Na+ symporter